ncbi:MAG: TonB-dependent receptor [Bdellovibrionales bacterium]
MNYKVLSASALLAIALNANATEKIDYEKVEVKGSRAESLKLTKPDTHTFSSKDLSDQSFRHTDDIWNLIPNLSISGGSNRTRYIQIRGIGERSEYDSVPTNSVGFYYDHIDLSGTGGISTTFDINQIEVLKGPQSYLFGDSSIGGNILIKSSSPEDSQAVFNASAGSQSHHTLSAQVNKPVTENLSLKLGVQRHKSDGFYKNIFLNEHTSSQNEVFFNSGVTFNIGKAYINSRHIYAKQKNGYDVWNAYSENFDTFTDKPGKDHQTTQGHSLEVVAPLTKDSVLTLISSISNSDILYSYDEDWGNNIFWNQLAGHNSNYDYNKSYEREKQNLHTKAIFQKTFSSLLWSTGIHYYERKENAEIVSYKNSAVKDSLNTDYSSKNTALFTSVEKSLNPKIKLNAALRFERQKLKYNDSSLFSDRVNSDLFGFNTSMSYALSKKQNLKLTISRGFKGAGLNADTNLTDDQKKYSPESLISYELSWIGLSKLIDYQVNLFYMNRDNQQISASAQNNPLDPSDFTIFTDNASKSENYGLEVNSLLLPTSKVNIQLSAGLLKAKFKKYSREGVVYDRRELAHAPDYTYSVILNYKPTDKLQISLAGSKKGSFYFSNSHNQKSRAYFLLHSSISYKLSNTIKVSAWGRNLLDKQYATRGFYFPNRPPNWESELYTQNGPPLEWGLNLNIVL